MSTDGPGTCTGGVLAKAAAEGIRTVLVTCTDGRCGDGPDGVKPGDPGHDPDKVVELRRRELERSCEVLNVSHLELLGYADSGMMDWPTNDAPGSFWATPVDEAAARLAELMQRHQPDVVVTYDENGFYGHPDHIQAHRVAMRAAELAGDGGPSKIYYTAMPRSVLEGGMEAFRGLENNPFADVENVDDLPFGHPDDEIAARIDGTDRYEQKVAAMRAH